MRTKHASVIPTLNLACQKDTHYIKKLLLSLERKWNCGLDVNRAPARGTRTDPINMIPADLSPFLQKENSTLAQ